MDRYCAFHVKTKDGKALISELELFLAHVHCGQVIQRTVTQTIGELYGAEFLCSEYRPPTKFAVIAEPRGWFTTQYNSLFCLEDMAAEFSCRLNTVAITVMAQTRSSAYRLSIYKSGRHLRTLEFADGTWIEQEGTPLAFESEPLAENISEEGEEPFYVFDTLSVREYCEHFGLRLWARALRMERPQFTIIRTLPAKAPAMEQLGQAKHKPFQFHRAQQRP